MRRPLDSKGNELVGDDMGGLKKNYLPTTIDIIHTFKDDQTPYKNHPINKMIQLINEFINTTFKSRQT